MATPTIPSAELDPTFLKALKLLRSKNKDSLDQLKKMLDDVLALRRPDGRRDDDHEPRSFSKLGSKRDKEEQQRKRESEKRNLEKLQQDLVDLTGAPTKKQKVDHGDRDSKERERKSHDDKSHDDRRDRDSERKEKKRMVIESSSESESESSDDEKQSTPKIDTEQFDLDLGDLACIVCKNMDVTSGNNLVECQDCHSLYHQECHRPPVTEDINDPRFVWYCNKCAKNMKKMASKSSKSKSSSSQPMKDIMKSGKSEPAGIVQPFRRMEPTKPSSTKESSSSSSSRPMGGLASLAANLSTKESSKTVKESSLFAAALSGGSDVPVKVKSSSSKGESSKSSSSTKESHKSGSSSKSSSSGQKSSSSSSSRMTHGMINAEKKIQQIKKEAIKKAAEKKYGLKRK